MTIASPTSIEEPENVKPIDTFESIRSCHLHLDDWSLIVTALENLVIDLERSEGRWNGNLLQRAEGLRHNINHVILESDDE